MTEVFHPDQRPVPHLVHYVGRQRGSDPLPRDVRGLTTEQRLSAILVTGLLRGFVTTGTVNRPVVCVSDASPAELEASFRIGMNARGRVEPWALVFDRQIAWETGIRPALYADTQLAHQLRYDFFGEHPTRPGLVQRVDPIAGDGYTDWSHEREWRWVFPVSSQVPDPNPTVQVWPILHAVIAGRQGWKPDGAISAYPERATVQRWSWTGTSLVHDGTLA
ncbi:hypothetical protein [Cellulomonas algicola]|uniref:hypothetical protein n=1 Tax=Cellulomonas algicola TaxID=2071633 RepID=UPI000F572628|nr:hypothetical protein [Cellulomonas algicola]